MNNNNDDANERAKKNKSSSSAFWDIFIIAGVVIAFCGGLALINIFFGTPIAELKGAFIFFIIGLAMYGIGRIIKHRE